MDNIYIHIATHETKKVYTRRFYISVIVKTRPIKNHFVYDLAYLQLSSPIKIDGMKLRVSFQSLLIKIKLILI